MISDRKRRFSRYQIIVIIGTIFLGIFLRFMISRIGYNFDFESYLIVGKIVTQGGNVYAETARYNYGPIFFNLQGFAYRVASLFENTQSVYRYLIISYLTLADIGLMLWVLKRSTVLNAVIFFLNPVSIIITGYHNQFDNIAVLFGFLALDLINEQKQFTNKDFGCMFLLALSLSTKHLLYAFPLWILINQTLPAAKRLAYSCVPVFLFGIGFLPFAMKGHDGILANVIKYQSFNNFPLLFQQAFDLNVFLGLSTAVNYQKYFRIIFILLMIMSAILFRKKPLKDSLLLYFICLVCFSSAIANQYLAIPLAAIFVFKDRLKYLYVFLIGLYLCLDLNGLNWIALHPEIKLFNDFVLYGYSIAAWILLMILVRHHNDQNGQMRPTYL